jgi:hypothetical protein
LRDKVEQHIIEYDKIFDQRKDDLNKHSEMLLLAAFRGEEIIIESDHSTIIDTNRKLNKNEHKKRMKWRIIADDGTNWRVQSQTDIRRHWADLGHAPIKSVRDAYNLMIVNEHIAGERDEDEIKFKMLRYCQYTNGKELIQIDYDKIIYSKGLLIKGQDSRTAVLSLEQFDDAMMRIMDENHKFNMDNWDRIPKL